MSGCPPSLDNDRYRGLYQQTAAQLRSEVQNSGIELRNDETPLNAMSGYDLSMNELANMMALKTGNPATVFAAANGLRDWHEQQSGTKLAPTWENKRMTPSGARTALNGQFELPV